MPAFYDPPEEINIRFGICCGDPKQMRRITIGHGTSSCDVKKPDKKDPKTFIGWAFKAFMD